MNGALQLGRTWAVIGLLIGVGVFLLAGGPTWIGELTGAIVPSNPAHDESLSIETQPGLAGNSRPPKPAASGRVEGRVLASGSGEVIPNVRLRLVGRDATGASFSKIERTDGAGSFAFDAVPVGDDHLLHVEAASEIHSVPSIAVLKDEVTSIGTVWLARGAVLDGVVRDETRAPIAGASLRVFRSSDVKKATGIEDEIAPRYEAESDELGRFAIADVASGAYTIEVRAADKVGERAYATIANGQLVMGPLDILLREGARVAGRVVDVAGKGIPGARIESPFVGGVTTTDEDGRFILLAPPERRYESHYLYVTATGYPGLFMADWSTTEEQTIVLFGGAHLTLHVSADGSGPLPEAEVSIGLTLPDGTCYLDGVTNSAGVLELEAPVSTVLWISVEHADGHALVWNRGDDAADGPVQGLTAGRIGAAGPNVCRIRVPRLALALVVGRVTDAAGDPIAGASIQANTPMAGAFVTTSGADGSYSVDVRSRDAFHLRISAPGFLGYASGLDWQTADASESLRADARLTRGATVVGRVVDDAGAPVAGASVWVADHSAGFFSGNGLDAATSDAEGVFVIRGVAPAKSLWLTASRRGLVDRFVDLGEHLGGVLRVPDIRMGRGATLGVVVLTPDGRPAVGARVTRGWDNDESEFLPGFSFFGASHDVLTRATGHADLEHVQAGTSTLYATLEGTAGVMREIDTTALETDERLVLRLRPGFTARGRVVDDRGLPVEDAVVDVVSGVEQTEQSDAASWVENWVDVVESRTDATGRFEVEDLPEVRLTLYIRATGYQAIEVPLLVGGEEVELRLDPIDPALRDRREALEAERTELQARLGNPVHAASQAQTSERLGVIEDELDQIESQMRELDPAASCGGACGGAPGASCGGGDGACG